MKTTANSTLRNSHSIEVLEARIAPAVIIGPPNTASYFDVDGDQVKIVVSAGTLTLPLFTTVLSGSGDQLQKINLSGGGFAGANITFSVVQVAGGNGLANVGHIDSTGYNLGTVTVKGDLGQIDAGSNHATVSAILSLKVHSLGRLGTDTQAFGGDLNSAILGKLGSLTVKQDFAGGFVGVTGVNGKIGPIAIDGSLIGIISSTGDTGTVTIGRDVQGGSGPKSGSISSGGQLGVVKIFGSLIGGSGDNSGQIYSTGDMGAVTIYHNVDGGSALAAGTIISQGKLGVVKIYGSLAGGLGNNHSGSIFSTGDMGAVTIYQNMEGSLGYRSGTITCNGNLTSVKIHGSLIGGDGARSGAIDSTGDMGTVTVGFDVQGGAGFDSGHIYSNGKLALVGGVHIGGSLIGGSVGDSGRIFANGDMGAVTIGHDVQGGSGTGSGFIHSNGKIGAVKVLGSLTGGSNTESGKISSGGTMGAVTIYHNVQGGSGADSGFILSGGKIGVVKILGSLIGDSNTNSGAVFSIGDMSAVTIGYDVKGGSGFGSGRIQSDGKLALVGGVKIGGSLIGGSNIGIASSPISSGSILSKGDMGVVTIGQDLLGGSGYGGHIRSNGKLAGVNIAGSLIGGLSFVSGVSGEIFSIGDMGPVTIGHDFTGGSIIGTDSLDRSGFIQSSAGRIASVKIGGSIISGIDDSTGALTRNATIRAANDIGSLTVGGSLIGRGDTGTGASPVVISARGKFAPTSTSDLAIGPIKIGGRVEFANILAGYDIVLNPVNGDAQIGAVTVGGDWVASNLVAGVMNTASGNTKFGDANDASIGVGTAGILAKIASITIAGQVFGTPASGSITDHFGFVAQHVLLVNVGTVPTAYAIALAAGPHNDNRLVGETSDMFVHEV